MPTLIFKYRSTLPFSAETVFAWHSRQGALPRMIPPWQNARVLAHGGIQVGQRTVLKMKIPFTPFWKKWVAEVVENKQDEEGYVFSDLSRKSPFSYWKHFHRVMPQDEASCILEDEVHFKLPLSSFTHWYFEQIVRKELERAFAYRHRILRHDLSLEARYPSEPKKIVIAGGSGLIGTAFTTFLRAAGHEVHRFVRKPTEKAYEIYLHPEYGIADASVLEGFDAVVNLAGENVAGGRWTEARKGRIYESRIRTTGHLVQVLERLEKPPEVFISASAIGFYGESSHRAFTETSPRGEGFLPTVCHDWEAMTMRAQHAGIRVVHPRFGIVLSIKGGALKKLLLPFQLGLGSRIGSGKQYMSWISIDDTIGVLYHILQNNVVTGAINVVSPNPVSNAEFTKTMLSVLNRPLFFPISEKIIRRIFGEMGEQTILLSQNVSPERLKNQSFNFVYPRLTEALRHILGKGKLETTSRSKKHES